MSDGMWTKERNTTPPKLYGVSGQKPPLCTSQRDGYWCTRTNGHPGRHLASTGAHSVVAAWPGDGRPTESDLSEVPS